MLSPTIEIARREWEDSHRRLEEYSHDRPRYRGLLAQVDAILAELRRRVGQTFTLAELAEAYADVERWSRDAVADNAPSPDWPRTLSLVEGAAFHVYARGALDYQP